MYGAGVYELSVGIWGKEEGELLSPATLSIPRFRQSSRSMSPLETKNVCCKKREKNYIHIKVDLLGHATLKIIFPWTSAWG